MHLKISIPFLVFLLNLDSIQAGQGFFNEDDDLPAPSMDLQSRLESGEKSYAMLKSETSKYGICWINAVENLPVGCKHLNDDTQARLGLAFANCFLEKIGSVTYPCPAESSIQSCVSSMDDRAYQAFTQFFTHTQSVCFFLANQVWQSKAEDTIHRLSTTSMRVGKRLERIQDLQEKSIDTQIQLNQEISGSKATLESFEKTLMEKHSIEQEMLNRFLEIRQFVLTEVSQFYSIGFYVTCLAIFYLTTTPVRTSDARLWIFGLFALNFVLERLAVSDVLSNNDKTFNPLWLLTDDIDSRIWFIRRITMVVSVILLVYFAMIYKDYAAVNNSLLQDIQKQNEELKQLHYLSLSRRSVDMTDSCVRHEPVNSKFYSSNDSDSDIDSGAEVEFEIKKQSSSGSQTLLSEEVTSTSDEEGSQVQPVVYVRPASVSKSRASTESSISSRYNLRDRRSLTPAKQALTPPAVKSRTKKPLKSPLTAVQQQQPHNLFSSDEEV